VCDVVFLQKLKSFIRTISKRAIIPWHRAHTLSSADTLLLRWKAKQNSTVQFHLSQYKMSNWKKK